MNNLCPKCDSPIDGANPYCRACYSAYRRQERATNKLARKKSNARTLAKNAYQDGKIFKHNCALCHSEDSQMHHPDYDKPLDVIWLCLPCHNELHSLERKAFAA